MTPPPLDRRTLIGGATAAGLGSLLGGSASALPRGASPLALPALVPPAVAALAPVALGSGSCTLTPQSTPGPFYFDAGLVRQDITEGKPGLPLFLFLQLLDASQGCAPMAGAVFDAWQCDALGKYSGYAVKGTPGETFLRGIQFTDANGIAMFQTIYPGQYPGRTTHIHLRARPNLQAPNELTGQLYFDDVWTKAIRANVSPYDMNPGAPTFNLGDGIYVGSGGVETTMPVFLVPGPPLLLVAGIQIKVA